MGKLWAKIVKVLGGVFIIADIIVLIVSIINIGFLEGLGIALGLLVGELLLGGPLYAISGLYDEIQSVNDNLYDNLEEVNNNVISAKKEIISLITGTSEQISVQTQAIMHNQQNDDEFKLQYIGEKVFYAKDGKYYCPECKKPVNPDMFSCSNCNADFVRK